MWLNHLTKELEMERKRIEKILRNTSEETSVCDPLFTVQADDISEHRVCEIGKVGHETVQTRDTIVNDCIKEGTFFHDAEFDRTWCGNETVVWKPPRDVPYFGCLSTPWTVYSNKPKPEDVLQGQIGNCWFLAALASVARFPWLVRKMLLSDKYSEQGVYAVQICQDGRWQSIIVDDHLPWTTEGVLLCAKAKKKQLWVLLIEKAMAKYHGFYYALTGGQCREALTQLTGVPSEDYYIKHSDGRLRIDPLSFWKELITWFRSDQPMCAEIRCTGEDQMRYQRIGLSASHAYSIMDMHRQETEMFIKLRDPTGNSHWKGKGSEYGTAGGIFWITYLDFIKYFSVVTICRTTPTDYELRVGGWLPSNGGKLSSYWKLTVDIDTQANIGLFLKRNRNLYTLAVKQVASAAKFSCLIRGWIPCMTRVMNWSLPLMMACRRRVCRQFEPIQPRFKFVVVRRMNISDPGVKGVIPSGWSLDGFVSCSMELKMGEYYIIPQIQHYAKMGGFYAGRCVITIHSNEQVLCEESKIP